ncbi:MAG: hypothetical protein JJ895_09505 [Balneolaceae bacterium]|nr:hypothetical protein [Balneolaceae bacterium]
MNPVLYLKTAAICSFSIALLHVAIMIVGGEWYVFFGAGQEMARLDETGSWYPKIVNSVIAVIFSIWGCYALSAAGMIKKLPFLRTVILSISGILILRGISGFILPFTSTHPFILQNSIPFWMITSVISTLLGLLFLLGLIGRWGYFKR